MQIPFNFGREIACNLRKMSTDNNNSISIKDNNSQILSTIPTPRVIPLTIISKVKGYDGSKVMSWEYTMTG